MVERIPVAVMGATGLVGQRFIQLLHKHPWFELVSITASERRIGQKYGETVRWMWSEEPPEEVQEMKLSPTNYEGVRDAEIVFSALPSSVARELEPELAKRGKIIVSNASPFRMDDDVPLINPEINPDHLKLIPIQREKRNWKGFIAKNPNCTTAILTLSLKPLLDNFGISNVRVATMQAVSGAGYEGVVSMDIIDNIIPFIKEEEEKVHRETKKILGTLTSDRVEPLNIGVSASCHRVPVLEGHLEAVFVELKEKPEDVNGVVKALSNFKGKPQELKLPTAPEKPIVVRSEPDRPQPRFDRMTGGGMSVVVGRIRWSEIDQNEIKYMVLGSNTIRGAAGTAVLIAELLRAENMI